MQSDRELIPFEPIQYVKAHTSVMREQSVWSLFNEGDPQQIGAVSSLLRSKIWNLLQNRKTDVVFSRGERIIFEQVSSMEDVIELPYANSLSLLGISMTILLENFQSTVINEPIGEILKGKDLENSIIIEHKSQSLIEILSRISNNNLDSTAVLNSDSLFENLSRYGEVALYFFHSILESSANEAWMDALMAFGIDKFSMDSGHLWLTVHDVFQYSLTVMHDINTMSVAPNMDIPLQDQRYLFGWWVNCPSTLDHCLFPKLPKDLIFSLSPSLRIYISATFDLILIVSERNSGIETIKDVIESDWVIWNEIYLVLSAESNLTMVTDRETFGDVEKLQDNQTDLLADVVHYVWPIMVFIFWVVSSHIWVYWMFHCCWFMATRVSKRTHVLRPRTAINK